MELLRVPQINANEGEVEVVEVRVGEGEEVVAGQVLCVLESTKATMDVEAPTAGFVRKMSLETGQRVAVGQLICALTPGADDAVDMGPEEEAAPAGNTQMTRRARALIAEYELAADKIAYQGILTERDVLAFLASDGVDLRSPRDQSSAPDGEDFGASAIVIYGAGGHARVIIDLIRQSHPELTIAGIVDDAKSPPSAVAGVPVVGNGEALRQLRERGVAMAALGVGAVTHNALRARLCERLQDMGFRLPNLIHTGAIVEPSVQMGQGNQIFGGAVVSSQVRLGDNTIINSNAVVSHDCRIGDHAHITPGALLAGGVTVGARTVIGMAATIYLGVDIGADVVVANGQDVVGDIGDGEVVRG